MNKIKLEPWEEYTGKLKKIVKGKSEIEVHIKNNSDTVKLNIPADSVKEKTINQLKTGDKIGILRTDLSTHRILVRVIK
ncbi:MAG: hypothetical protein ACOC5T_00315 [Elusimicrobiota bacterium]